MSKFPTRNGVEVRGPRSVWSYREATPRYTNLSRHKSKVGLSDTIVSITERFCDGYGPGIKGIVVESPHEEFIGKTFALDGRDRKMGIGISHSLKKLIFQHGEAL